MLIAIVGTMGCGKTLLMTYLGYCKHAKGQKVISNYGIKFPHEKLSKELLESYFVDKDKKRQGFSNCVILWDELTVYLDARRSASKKNLLLAYLLLQSRKRNVDIIFTTQEITMIDKRWREHVSMIFYPTIMKDPKTGRPNKQGWINIKKVDIDNNKISEYNWNLRKFFKMYDTNELIFME